MPPRLRKFIGTIILLIFVPGYTLLTVALATVVLPGSSGWGQLAFYIIGGLAWVLPAGLIITWMGRPRRAV